MKVIKTRVQNESYTYHKLITKEDMDKKRHEMWGSLWLVITKTQTTSSSNRMRKMTQYVKDLSLTTTSVQGPIQCLVYKH